MGPQFLTCLRILTTMRACLPEWTVFVGLTATLEPGVEMDMVMQSVGFRDSFHFEKHYCERHNIDLIIREIKYPYTGHNYRDLDQLISVDITGVSDLPK